MKWLMTVLVMSLAVAGSTQAQAADPVGEQFQVNSYTTGGQDSPAVAVESQGNFVVVWDSSGSDGTDTSNVSIQGQRFAVSRFSDGFGSGDTSAWSTTVP